MSESQNYTPSQILAIAQRAEAEGKFEYATQFYSHLADHFRHSAEGHEALYGLQRIEHYRQAQAAGQVRGNQVQAPTHAQVQAPRRESQLSTHAQQARQTTGGRPAARTAQKANRQDRSGIEHQGLIAGAARSSLPAPVSDHEDEEDARMPRLVARAGQPGEDDREQYHPYRVGRTLTSVLAAAGWALLCGGVLLLMAGLAGVPSTFGAAGVAGMPLGFELGLAAIVLGVMLLFLAHLARAVFDSAAAARELVEIERAKAGW